MNNRQIITLIVVAVAALAAGYFIGAGMNGIRSEGQVNMKNQADSLNYFLGLSFGYDLAGAPWEADAELIASGMHQVLNDSSSFDQMTAQSTFRQLNIALQDQEAKAAEIDALDNLEKGAAFLEENGKKEGIVTTESGLQYEIVELIEGPSPADTSLVSVMYHGTLLDGTVFDSTMDSGDTISFPLNQVIPGWTEGLQLMTPGSTFNFYIPSNLGYGSRASGPIPGNSVLIFKVKLIEFE